MSFIYEPRHAKRALSVAVTLLRNDVIFFEVKISTRVCFKFFHGLKSLWRHENPPEQCKISKSAPDSYWAIYMIFIYKITDVKFCISLRKYSDVSLAVNDASAYTPWLWPHRKLILTAMLLKFSQINLKMMAIQKIGK